MSQKCQVFQKKTLKMPGWQHCEGRWLGDAAAAVIPLDIRFHTHTNVRTHTRFPPKENNEGNNNTFPFSVCALGEEDRGPPGLPREEDQDGWH